VESCHLFVFLLAQYTFWYVWKLDCIHGSFICSYLTNENCVLLDLCAHGIILLVTSAPDDGESSVMMQPANSMEQSPLWEANSYSASQEIFCVLWNLVVHYHVYRTAHHLPISWVRLIQSVLSNPVSLWSIFVLSFHLCQSFPCGLFLLYFSTKILYAFLFSSHTNYMPGPSHSRPSDHPNDIW